MATKHPKRPRDSNQLAKMILDLATGDANEAPTKSNAVPARAAGGKAGGQARAKALSPQKRAEIAKHEAAIADLQAYIRVEESKNPIQGALSLLAAAKPPSPIMDLIEAGRGAKKRNILHVLLQNPGGVRTPEIVEALIKRGMSDTTVQNTSPQLSAYGSADPALVRHDGSRWFITDAGRNYLLAAKN